MKAEGRAPLEKDGESRSERERERPREGPSPAVGVVALLDDDVVDVLALLGPAEVAIHAGARLMHAGGWVEGQLV